MYHNRHNAPRLHSFNYKGSYSYFLTLSCYKRNPYFLDSSTVHLLIPILITTSTKFDFTIYVYCFMPNHLHLLTTGGADADLPRFVQAFKQKSSYTFRCTKGMKLWQRSYYDHVLRHDEALADIAKYILNNPVRGGLVNDFREYEFSGSSIFDIGEIVI